MKKHFIFVAAVMVAAAAMIYMSCQAAAQERPAPAEQPAAVAPVRSGVLVMPALITYFKKKDKFYGMSEEFSAGLQQFFSLSLKMLSTHEVKRVSPDALYNVFPQEKVFPNATGTTLVEKIDVAQLKAAADAYNARLVVCMEVPTASVLVEGDINWTVNATMRTVVYNAEDGKFSEEKTYSHVEKYSFASKEEAAGAQGGTRMTFGGRLVTPAEVNNNPMIFGGTIGGYPFVPIARSFVEDARYY